MNGPAVDQAAARIEDAARRQAGPLIVAIDGRSGTGKSTLAEALAKRLPAVVIEGDDFYAGGIGLAGDPPHARAARCIDWQAQRPVLSALRQGQPARYHAFDWDAFDGSLSRIATEIAPAPIVILEGVYAARPELRDLFDLCILVRVPDALRQARLIAREGALGPWELQWHEAEEWYFADTAPVAAFDLMLDLD
ncbi:uridine kinase [Tabrizicola sp.]|uniref:uridine kinase family protein n=1 Tax=Tabrizicola sp. TaxID=2005166 RepID=UPI002734E632|nr:AAA family ATPase [Tabrizicola sp.]MDP3195735.1 AAA family ATPase [Tabrizicola sp.]